MFGPRWAWVIQWIFWQCSEYHKYDVYNMFIQLLYSIFCDCIWKYPFSKILSHTINQNVWTMCENTWTGEAVLSSDWILAFAHMQTINSKFQTPLHFLSTQHKTPLWIIGWSNTNKLFATIGYGIRTNKASIYPSNPYRTNPSNIIYIIKYNTLNKILYSPLYISESQTICPSFFRSAKIGLWNPHAISAFLAFQLCYIIFVNLVEWKRGITDRFAVGWQMPCRVNCTTDPEFYLHITRYRSTWFKYRYV